MSTDTGRRGLFSRWARSQSELDADSLEERAADQGANLVRDCVRGSQGIMASDFREPINLGSSELVSINRLVDIAEEIAGIKLDRRYKLDAPKGVRGRNSDNTLIQKEFGWEPSIRLKDGLERTYAWIWDELKNDRRDSVFTRERYAKAA